MLALYYVSYVVREQRKRHGDEVARTRYQNRPYCLNEINAMILENEGSSVLP